MSLRSARWRTVALLLGVLVVGCDLLVQPIALSTSDEIRRAGPTEDCAAWAAGEPVSGVLEFVQGAGQAETFVVTDDGLPLLVVWPAGFTGTTADGGTIIDDLGVPLFTDGEEIRLGQVDERLHEGSAEDPFVVSGILNGSCFVPPPPQFGGD